jgi:hypothetical protein
MRPLELVPVEDMDGNEKRKPLLQRMAEEKRCESHQYYLIRSTEPSIYL